MKKFGFLIIAAVLGSVLTLSAFYYFDLGDSRTLRIEHANNAPVLGIGYTENEEGEMVPLDFTGTAERVMKAVVHITNTQTRMRQQRDPFMDMFEEWFNMPRGQQPRGPQPVVGFGSGVIISEDGYIITNNHVIEGADDLEVMLADDRVYKAKLIGMDPSTDIALLKIKEDNLPYLTFANSDNVRVGEWVLAAGNPFNFYSTVTAGIVSAKARSINIIREQYAIESFIQTDAAINRGNSGGALVNLNGDLIGINTAIASPTGVYSGYGFAIPSNIVSKVAEDLSKYGYVKRGILGVMITNVNGKVQKERGLDVYEGVLVDSIMPNTAAEKTGLKKNDVIIAVNGEEVRSASELQAKIGIHSPGDKVRLTVNRFGKEMNFEVKLQSREDDVIASTGNTTFDVLGAEFQTLDKEAARKLNIEGGVQVTKLGRGKLRKETNMREGFIITSVDGKPVRNVKELEKILENKEGGVLIEGIYEDIPGVYYYAFGMES